MKMIQTLSLLLLLTLTFILSGCGGTSVEKTKTPQIQTRGTLGQQLIDLYAAFLSGAINEDQYNELKEDLLERYED